MSFSYIINFLSKNVDFSILLMMQLFFIQKRYIPIIILNVAIIFSLILGVNKLVCLEMSVMLSIYSLTLHNRRFKITSITGIIFFSCGCFLIALKDINQQFIFNIVQSIPYLSKYNNLIQDLYLIVALFFIIGFIPFTEWAMYLFSISSSLFKIVCFITPMFINIKILTDLHNILNPASIQIAGYMISIYSCIYIIFNKNIRSVFVYIITYFYGIEIFSISNLNCYIFMCVAFAVLLFLNTLIPIRTVKYNIASINFMLPTIFSKILFTSFLFILLYCFVIHIFTSNIKTSKTNLILLSLFVVFFSKIISYFSINNRRKDNKQQYIDLRIYRMIRMSICNILLLYSFYKTFDYSIFKKPDFIVVSIIITTFFITFILFILTNTFIKTNISKTDKHRRFLIKMLSCCKITILIVQNIFIDFVNSIKERILQLSISSIPKKISNILYEQNVYFYIFFLVQLIIVLTIECVII